MSKIAGINEPANELERLIADLSGSGPLILVSASAGGPPTWPGQRHWCSAVRPTGAGSTSTSATTRRAGRWMRAMRSPGFRFVRGPNLFPSFPGQECLTVEFLGPGGDTVLGCSVGELYDGPADAPR
jgi:hypothetical protein